MWHTTNLLLRRTLKRRLMTQASRILQRKTLIKLVFFPLIRCLDCGRAEEFTLQKKAAAIPRFLNNLHYSPPTIVVIDPIPRECSQLRRVAFGRFFFLIDLRRQRQTFFVVVSY